MFELEEPWGQSKPPVGFGLDRADPINSGIDSLWLFNESAGSVVADIANLKSGAITAATWNSGFLGPNLRFNGSSSFVDVGSSFLFQTAFSFSLWVNHRVFKNYSNILIRNNSGDQDFVGLITLLDGTTQFQLANVVTPFGFTAATVMTAGKWYHIVASSDPVAGSQKMYFNGVVDANSASNANKPNVRTTSLLFGKDGINGRYLDGDISQVRLYKRILTYGEVLRLYTEPFAGIQQRKIQLPYAPAAAPGGGVFNPYFYQQHVAGGMHGESA